MIFVPIILKESIQSMEPGHGIIKRTVGSKPVSWPKNVAYPRFKKRKKITDKYLCRAIQLM